MTDEKTTVIRSIEGVDDPIAREKLETLRNKPFVLGVMLWGSRATGFGAPGTDWDALVYVTDKYYFSLDVKETIWLEYDESVEPKRLVIDFSPISDAWFRQQIESPLDIDHFPYEEGVVIYDPTGKLEEWRAKLARYPEEEHVDRLKNKYFLMAGALGNSGLNRKREQLLDMKVNIYRAIIAGVNLWFTIKKSWTPPLKWWERHVRRLGIDEETFNLFANALDNPSVEAVYHLFQKLKSTVLEEGYDFPNDPITAFLETIHTEGRPAQIRHSYL